MPNYLIMRLLNTNGSEIGVRTNSSYECDGSTASVVPHSSTLCV